MGPKSSILLAAVWAVIPWVIRSRRDAGVSPFGTMPAIWIMIGLILAWTAGTPPIIWWMAWIWIVGISFVEFPQAGIHLRRLAEMPASFVEDEIKPLDQEYGILCSEGAALRNRASEANEHYQAMRDFHRTLRLSDFTDAVVEKMLKLGGVAMASVEVTDKDGKNIVGSVRPVGLPFRADPSGISSLRWTFESVVEDNRVRYAVRWPEGVPCEKARMEDFAVGLSTLWRRSLLYAQVEAMAVFDRLTGMYVRREFDARITREVDRAREKNQPMCLVMVDVDYFKRFNDTYGHLTGDAVLKLVGQTLKSDLRSTDFGARYGGEEFSIILPETVTSGAFLKAERLRQAIEKIRVPYRDMPLGVTASFGVAALAPGDGVETLVHRADQALYRAKESGRNRVVVSED